MVNRYKIVTEGLTKLKRGKKELKNLLEGAVRGCFDIKNHYLRSTELDFKGKGGF